MCSLPDELLTMLGLGVEVCSLWIPESVWHGLFSWCGDIGGDVHSYIAPENRPSQMESCIPTSNHPFSGAMLVSGRVIHRVCMGFIWCWSDSMHFVGSMGHQNTKKSTCFKRIKAARIFENCRLTVSTNRFRFLNKQIEFWWKGWEIKFLQPARPLWNSAAGRLREGIVGRTKTQDIQEKVVHSFQLLALHCMVDSCLNWSKKTSGTLLHRCDRTSFRKNTFVQVRLLWGLWAPSDAEGLLWGRSEVVLASVYFYENLGYRNIKGAYVMHTENVQGWYHSFKCCAKMCIQSSFYRGRSQQILANCLHHSRSSSQVWCQWIHFVEKLPGTGVSWVLNWVLKIEHGVYLGKL